MNVDNTILHALNGFFFHHDVVEDTVLAYVNAAEVLFLAALLVTFRSCAARLAAAPGGRSLRPA